jgi:hypothetical protein
MTFIPVLGELTKNGFVLNTISLVTGTLLVNYNEITYKAGVTANSCIKITIPLAENPMPMTVSLNGDKRDVNISAFKDCVPTYKIVNCDCQFTPESGLWQQILDSRATVIFHLGDQVYMDLLFLKIIRTIQDYSDLDIRREVYAEYARAFSRKFDVLSSSHNIMLGDDHDIVDESIRTKYPKGDVDRVIGIFKLIYNEIQQGLRLTSGDSITFENKTFILVGNIEARNDLSYLEYIQKIVEKELPKVESSELYILSPRVPMNNKIGCLVNLVFEKDENNLDYIDFYEMITHKNKTTIICGDEHTAKKYNVRTKYGECTIYFAGPINSPPDPYNSKDYIKGAFTEEIYSLPVNSFLSLDKEMVHHTKDVPCCSFPSVRYIYEYFCAKYC